MRRRKSRRSSNRVDDAPQSRVHALSSGAATEAESDFSAALSQELRHPTPVDVSVDRRTVTPELPPTTPPDRSLISALTASPDRTSDTVLAVAPDRSPQLLLAPAPKGPTDWPVLDFWNEYDEARAAADLFAVPPADIVAVVGPLEVAAPVAEKCQGLHWAGAGRVFVLTDRPHRVARPWTVVPSAAELVAALEQGDGESPVLILDVHEELPAGVRRLVDRLRQGGVGMVRYVLDGDPTDEDLSTWHAEMGRPSVLDLAGPLEPRRVLALLDRGEPVASVAGIPITAELLLALRVEVAGDR